MTDIVLLFFFFFSVPAVLIHLPANGLDSSRRDGADPLAYMCPSRVSLSRTCAGRTRACTSRFAGSRRPRGVEFRWWSAQGAHPGVEIRGPADQGPSEKEGPLVVFLEKKKKRWKESQSLSGCLFLKCDPTGSLSPAQGAYAESMTFFFSQGPDFTLKLLLEQRSPQRGPWTGQCLSRG